MSRCNALVTTRTGDEGYTRLLGPDQVPKYDSRVEALGLIDEANCALGLARALVNDPRIKELLLTYQNALYHLMAELAMPRSSVEKLRVARISDEDVALLDRMEDELKGQVRIDTRFVVPGESVPGARIDLARTVVRRAERHIARLVHEQELKNYAILRYLNRLSDVLFILARFVEGDRVRLAS